MQEIQDVFNRIRQRKAERKEIQKQYKDILSASGDYKDVQEKLRGYKLRKKQIEDQAREEMGSSYERLLTLKKDLELDQELLADLALSNMMKGETVKVQDLDKIEYEPVFKVTFKKIAPGESQK